MPDETRRKNVALDYFSRLNTGDVAAVVAMFAPNGRIEDPIGQRIRTGGDARGQYVADIVARRVEVVAGTPVAAHDERHVAVPHTITFDSPAGPRTTSDALAIFRIGPSGLIEQIRVFGGVSAPAGSTASAGTE